MAVPADYAITLYNGYQANAAVSTAEVHHFKNVNTSAPINASAFINWSAADGRPDVDVAQVTTTVPGCLVFAHLSHYHENLNGQTHSNPTNHLLASNVESSDSGNFNQVASTVYRKFPAAGATGAILNWDCTEPTGTNAITIRIAIAPAP